MSTSVVIEDDGAAGIEVRINEDVIFTADTSEYGFDGIYSVVQLVKELCDNFGIPLRNEVDMQFMYDYTHAEIPDA